MRGQSLVEFALTFPLIALLLTAGIDMANIILTTYKLNVAATEGVKTASQTINGHGGWWTSCPSAGAGTSPHNVSCLALTHAQRVLHASGINWWDATTVGTVVLVYSWTLNRDVTYVDVTITYTMPSFFIKPVLQGLGFKNVIPSTYTAKARGFLF